MKIVAVLEESVTVGGAFNQGLNAIIQMNRIREGRIAFEIFAARATSICSLGGACVRLNKE